APPERNRAGMRMLYPAPAESVDPAVVYSDMPHVDGRPSVRLNMIVSVDGGTSWNGVSGALGGAADKALFAVLRSLTDMILVASGTMRAEQYGPVVMPPDRQDERRARGQQPIPGIAVVSQRCDFDWSSPFFQAATSRPFIVTVASADAERRKRAAEVAEVIIAGDDSVDLTAAVAELGARGAATILAEGGPTLNGELAQAQLLDELCVSLSPSLASGDAKRLLVGSALDELTRLELHMICEADDYLFLRYRPVR
ncbi:MAG TPA: pyrimidine reductase family protein, partial [Acidimicrobiia bacterium]|nr:pyrimidine reductase family protein [Acidimicrobiia bacterium]